MLETMPTTNVILESRNQLSVTTGKRICVIMAHPDDVELLCFGTLLYFMDQGYEAHIVFTTDGENGASPGHPSKEAISKGWRRNESLAAFSKLRASVEFLSLGDGYLSMNYGLVSAVENCLRNYKPQIVITHFAAFSAVEHYDHIAVGYAVLNAASRVQSVKTMLQAQPLAAGSLPFVPNYFVSITPYLKEKMEAISQHQTQLDNHPYMTERFHECRAALNAFSAGRDLFADKQLYEAFFANRIIMN
jgi:LmbE family N-acetylglucosaminyl deacetylase